MAVLLIAEHNNKELRPFTLNAATAASQIDADVHAVIIGQNSETLYYLYMFPEGFEFKGSSPSRAHKLVKNILWEIGHPIYRAKQPNGYIDLEDEWLSPELIIRRLAAARRFADITNPNVNYDQDYFENVILKNFDHPENLLKLMKESTFYADRFAVFANSPEVMRA